MQIICFLAGYTVSEWTHLILHHWVSKCALLLTYLEIMGSKLRTLSHLWLPTDEDVNHTLLK